jgi:hypothetical protein
MHPHFPNRFFVGMKHSSTIDAKMIFFLKILNDSLLLICYHRENSKSTEEKDNSGSTIYNQ